MKINIKKINKGISPLIRETVMLALLYICPPLHIPEIKATSSEDKNKTVKVAR